VRTRKLFREDSHLCRFEARVVAVRAEGPWIALDATAFYPEEGGQRADAGTLESVTVTALEQDAEGVIWHRLARDPGWQPGQRVVGEVDASLRRDHRQQHSGQHVLSRAFEELLRAPTRAFHMGEEVSTIDIACSDLDLEKVARVEARANEVIFEDRPVMATEEARAGEEALWTVEIDGFDRQHCCGTHVRRSGEIGLVKVLRWERVKGMVRVHFVCGERAAAQFRRVLAAADSAARALSAGIPDLPQAVEGVVEQAKVSQRLARGWQEKWAELEAERWARTARREADGTLWVARWIEGAEAGTLRVAANALLAHAPVIAILGATGEPGKRAWIAARSPELPSGRDFDARAALAAVLEPLGGRGGGTPHFAQGACPAGEEACRAAITALAGGGGGSSEAGGSRSSSAESSRGTEP
jgi:alanyl-tRNA synthetase